MHFNTKVKVIEIKKEQERPNFLDKYYLVRFALDSDGISSIEADIWVHSNYPEEKIVKVAYTFLHRRLLDCVESIESEIYTPEEVDALWQSVKPEKIV
ncbi:MAG: hypothetical protein AAGE84_11980 [Cyanobacteria bacterium P01_G01_bin.39]